MSMHDNSRTLITPLAYVYCNVKSDTEKLARRKVALFGLSTQKIMNKIMISFDYESDINNIFMVY